jgi:predicted AAA+ superfamily ATPase
MSEKYDPAQSTKEIKRSYLEPIRYLLGMFPCVAFPCVALIGARQVGKSTLLHEFFDDVHIFDLELDRTFNNGTVVKKITPKVIQVPAGCL